MEFLLLEWLLHSIVLNFSTKNNIKHIQKELMCELFFK